MHRWPFNTNLVYRVQSTENKVKGVRLQSAVGTVNGRWSKFGGKGVFFYGSKIKFYIQFLTPPPSHLFPLS